MCFFIPSSYAPRCLPHDIHTRNICRSFRHVIHDIPTFPFSKNYALVLAFTSASPSRVSRSERQSACIYDNFPLILLTINNSHPCFFRIDRFSFCFCLLIHCGCFFNFSWGEGDGCGRGSVGCKSDIPFRQALMKCLVLTKEAGKRPRVSDVAFP